MNMECMICKHGQTRRGTATITLERNGTTVVFKAVPADVCTNCGEQYLDEGTTQRLLAQADTAAKGGVEVEIRSYAA